MAYKRISPQPVVEGGTGAQTLTNHGVLLGQATSPVTATTAGTAGQVLLGGATDPSFVTPTASGGLAITTNASTLNYAINAPVSIANGGTNATSMATTDGTVYYDGTRLVTTATGSSGQVLTSGGVGVAPAYSALPSSSISITGNTGGALTGTSFTFSGGTTGLSFGGSGTTETLTFAGITVSGGAVAINSGTNACGLSTDASATTVSLATGSAVKLVTLGSTNTTSSTAIKSGSGNVAINSGLTVDSTGRNYNTVQPCFFSYLNANLTNKTGDGTNYTVVFDAEAFDQGNNVSAGVFTAPIAGKYFFMGSVGLSGISVGHTTGYLLLVKNSFAEYSANPYQNAFATSALSPSGYLGMNGTIIFSLAASDTVTLVVNVTGSTKTVGLNSSAGSLGNGYPTYFTGYLIC